MRSLLLRLDREIKIMETKIAKTIQQYQMFAQGDRLLIALSGGADSVALLHFLRGIQEEWQLSLGALHLNHRLRGEESHRDEVFVRRLCREWEIPLTVESAEVETLAREGREGIELTARRCRYDFFEREAGKQGALIATAHTASDNAETMLLHLTRGTGPRGLAGIPPVRDGIIRPLIGCSRREVENYCETYGLSYVTDSTNRQDDYARNRIRHHVIPLLEEENPGFVEACTRTAKLLRGDGDWLDRLAEEAMEKLARPDGMLEREGFLKLPRAISGRILVELVRSAGVEAEYELIEALWQIVREGRGKRQLAHQTFFVCYRGWLGWKTVASPPALCPVDIAWQEKDLPCEIQLFPGKAVKISMLRQNKLEKLQIFQKKDLTYCLDCDRIDKIITIRQTLPGDKLRPLRRGCTKSLKQLFQEEGVPPEERSCRLVAADSRRLLWAEGLGIEEAVAADGRSRQVLIMEVTEGAHDRGNCKGTD